MDILEQFLTFPMIALCLVIFALVWAQRKALELKFPQLKLSTWWKEFWVPVGPLGTGALFGLLAKPYPWPEMFADSLVGRAVIGIVAGMLSGLAYRLIRKNLLERVTGKPSEEKPEDQDASLS